MSNKINHLTVLFFQKIGRLRIRYGYTLPGRLPPIKDTLLETNFVNSLKTSDKLFLVLTGFKSGVFGKNVEIASQVTSINPTRVS